jgi:hypothetical protein
MKVFVTTGCGNIIQGGADMWTNNFIELVLPQLSEYYILVDSKKPIGWKDTYHLEKNGKLHFHLENEEKTDFILRVCNEIHFLHANYHKREHLWKHKDKWGTIFVQAYLPDMLDYGDSLRQFNTSVVEEDVDYLLTHCKKRIWIGNNPSRIFNKFVTETITNFYEFKKNKPLNKINNKLGFASRIESRKNVHYLDGLPSYVLSGYYDWKNISETNRFDFSKVKYFKWNIDILESFMNLKWSISHSCHTKEPFGYSIFQAVDYGKLPILHSDWGEVDYKYRAESKEEFKKIYEEILSDNSDTHLLEFDKLKKYLKRFDNKKEWVEKISVLFNS